MGKARYRKERLNDGTGDITMNAGEDADRIGCLFGPDCCMPGEHFESECHTAEMLDLAYEDACPTCKGTGRVNPLSAPQGYFVASASDCPHCDGSPLAHRRDVKGWSWDFTD